jgi:hypothetical protein
MFRASHKWTQANFESGVIHCEADVSIEITPATNEAPARPVQIQANKKTLTGPMQNTAADTA